MLALYITAEAENLVMQSRLVSSVMLAYVYFKLFDKFAQNSLSNSNWVRVNKLFLLISKSAKLAGSSLSEKIVVYVSV